MIFRSFPAILLLFMASAIRDSFQEMEEAKDWTAFVAITKANDEVILYLTDSVNDKYNWNVATPLCNTYTKCKCVYGIEAIGVRSTFDDNLNNKATPAYIFYKNGEKTKEFGTEKETIFKQPDLEPSFKEFCV